MKNVFTLTLYLLLILKGNSSTSSYDYSSYNAVSTNTDLSGQTLASSTEDQSVVYINSKNFRRFLKY